PHLKKTGRGKIINIGSMMSIFGAGFAPAYAASKGGIVQFTRACATAWAKENIQVNAVLPGWIDTDLTRGARREVVGLHESVLARAPPRAAGAIRRISPGPRFFWRALPQISSRARRFLSTEATLCRVSWRVCAHPPPHKWYSQPLQDASRLRGRAVQGAVSRF